MKEKIKYDDRSKETYITPALNHVIIEMEQGIAAGSGSSGGGGGGDGSSGGGDGSDSGGGWGSL